MLGVYTADESGPVVLGEKVRVGTRFRVMVRVRTRVRVRIRGGPCQGS